MTCYKSTSLVVYFMFYSTDFCLVFMSGDFDINSLPSFYDSSKCSLSFLAPLEAILFDIDGTICDSDPLHYYAFRDMLQEVVFSVLFILIFSIDIPILRLFFTA